MTVPLQWVAFGAVGIAVLAVILAAFAMARSRRLNRRISRLLADVSSGNLEQILVSRLEAITELQAEAERARQRIQILERQQLHNLDRVGLVRFNPFEDTGADLSFALALLNAVGDGVVMTGLWGREEVRMYAKPIKARSSRYALSQEEKQAIELAVSARRPGESSPD